MDLQYAYANARIRAMEAKLLREQNIRDMMNVKSMAEVIALLEETAYKPALIRASTKHAGVDAVLYGLQDDLRVTLEKLASIIPKSARPAYIAVTAEWQANDIKNIILAKAHGVEAVYQDSDLVSKVLLKKLSKAKNIDEVFDILKASVYSAEISAVEDEFRKEKDFRLLLKAVDNHYYVGLAKLLKGDIDAVTKRLITGKIALANALIITRMKRDGLSKDAIARELIPLRLSAREKELLEAKDLATCIEILKRDGLGEDAVTLAEVEIALQKKFTERTLSMLRSSVMSFGVVLGYVYLKQTETDNLKKIALGKEFGIEEEMAKTVYAINK